MATELRAAEIEDIARRMKAAQDEVRQIEPFSSRHAGFDLPAAYAVAHRIHEARLRQGVSPIGRKIGFTNADMWSLYGVREPIWGYVYDTTAVRFPGQDHVCRLGRFVEPRIEPEIVFHFHAAPPADGDLREILECVDWVAHAFEIVQSHFPGWRFQAADTIADGGLHATLLLGEPRRIDDLGPDPIGALRSFFIALACDGKVRDTGFGANVLGHPLAAVRHLLAVLARQPRYPPLQAGELVTTGTLTLAHSLRAGETWRSEFQGIALPGLSARFEE